MEIQTEKMEHPHHGECGYVSCDVLAHGEYTGAGSIGLANINYLKDYFKNDTDLKIISGGYSFQQAWLLDNEKNRELLSELEDYPLFDDQYMVEVESEWEIQEWGSHLRFELLNSLSQKLQDYIEQHLKPNGFDPLDPECRMDQKLYELYGQAMEVTNTCPIAEQNSVFININDIREIFVSLVENEFKDLVK